MENYTVEHGILMIYANRPITQQHHDGLSRTQLFGTPERTDRRGDAVGVTEIANGRQVFMTHCHQCHPGGEAGLGPALNNKLLPAFVIRTQVRQGYGAMPAFCRNEISEAELESLIAYLKALRRHG